ncbi:DUF421 domain-containing protein [Hymenobacter negativus]|uniref:DUF421 domain-containing protein n=1 Tax=Hymenobacter negativus TaxID=2795026 RepID=A0ABS3QJ67_9BACT|nr:YetF domain-containing protein [Hymenobacter negativus]MBO2011296.1 DUF421 domain-containing protein [Hymenobacter negativus]
MKKEEIHFGDWHRLFIGNNPGEFLLEVAIRTIVIYLFLLLLMRFMGKRMNAQLNVVELSVMIMLGGIVSVAMQLPDRGLLHSIMTLGCMLVLYRGINWLAFKNQTVERLVQGDLEQVVADGELDLKAMANARLSREQLFAQLRKAKIQHLGQVKRVYMEANGEFSIYQQQPPKPGLSVLPDKDTALHFAEPADMQQQACERCGHTEPTGQHPGNCSRCDSGTWTKAVQLKQPRKEAQPQPEPALS